MQFLSLKQISLVILVFALLGVGIFSFKILNNKQPEITSVAETKVLGPTRKTIGQSVGGRPIEAYTYGNGVMHLAFVGGIHGGYEWNSVLLSYAFLDYLEANPKVIPKSLTVTVIPSDNPDGVYKVTGKEGRFTATDVSTDTKLLALARFNAHGVDLNRNFDCRWKPTSMWQSKVVSAGSKPFSEP